MSVYVYNIAETDLPKSPQNQSLLLTNNVMSALIKAVCLRLLAWN
jgi:hypothetical protein